MKCSLCGKLVPRARPVKARGGETERLFHCPSCDFAFFKTDHTRLIVEDKFEQARLRSAALDVPDIKTDFDNGFRQSLEYRKEYISAADRGKRVLEAGCSWGYFLKALQEVGIKPVGLEINPVRAGFVRRHLGIPCHQTLDAVEQDGLRFRKIFLFYVIQYIKDPVMYGQRLIELLEPGGQIYIITPNYHDVLNDVWNIKAYKDFFHEKMTSAYYSVQAAAQLGKIFKRSHGVAFHVTTRQGYGPLNHLLWHLDGKPRTTGIVGGDRYAQDAARRLAASATGLGQIGRAHV